MKDRPKSALGKGLASLLPGASLPPTPAPAKEEVKKEEKPKIEGAGAVAAGAATIAGADRHMGVSLCAPEDIQVNPFQPRRDFDETAIEELANSIKANGVIQPLVVRKTDNGYQLIAGERRLRASKKAGIKRVPIVIRRSTDRESLELALIENIQRKDLNCIDEALGYFQLIEEFSLTQDEIF